LHIMEQPDDNEASRGKFLKKTKLKIVKKRKGKKNR